MKKLIEKFKQYDKKTHVIVALCLFPWIFFGIFVQKFSPGEAKLFKDIAFALATNGIITAIGFGKELYDSKFLKNKRKFDKWDILVMTIAVALLSVIIIALRQITF